MDALTSALMSIRLMSPLLARLELGSDVSLNMTGNEPAYHAIPFHYVLSGSCRLVTVAGLTDLRAGDMIVLPRLSEHSLETGDASDASNIVDVVRQQHQPVWTREEGLDSPLWLRAGRGEQAAELLSGLFTLDGVQRLLTLDSLPDCIHMPDVGTSLAGLMQAALSFIASEGDARPGYAATSSRLLEAILSESLRVWVLTERHSPGLLRGLMHPQVGPLLQAIYRSPGDDWTVAAMAKRCGQSRSAFVRHFHAALAVAPATFVANVRCEHAERLICGSDMSIAQIAAKLGYGSTFAFSRAFRSQRHLTPAALRKQNRASCEAHRGGNHDRSLTTALK